MVAKVETLPESKLRGNRRSTSTSSTPSVVKKSSSISSDLGDWSTLIHKEAAEVSGGPTVIGDQQFGISDDLSIDRCSLVFERGACQGMSLDQVTGLYYARNRNYSPSLGRVLTQEPKSRLSAGAAYREINQDSVEYPSAAAQPRPSAPAGFHGIEEAYTAGECRWLPLNINGANTYEFVESNPVGNVDPWGKTYWESHGPFGPVVRNGQVEVYFVRELRPSWYNLLDNALGLKYIATKVEHYPISRIAPWSRDLYQAYQCWLNDGGLHVLHDIERVEATRLGLLGARDFVLTQWAGGASSEAAGTVGNSVGTAISGADDVDTIHEQGK